MLSRCTIVFLLFGVVSADAVPAPEPDPLADLIARGRYAEAEAEARSRLEATVPQDGPAAAVLIDILVESLWRGGKAGEAEAGELALKAIRIKEARLGAAHLDLAVSLDNLGHVHRARGEYASARGAFERALSLRETSLDPDDPAIAHSLNQLGWVQYRAGEFVEAKRSYGRSVAIRETRLGRDDPDVAASLNNLGILLKNLGDYRAARPLYERALSIYEKAYGESHPQVSRSLNNLAILLKSQGDYAAARTLYERAIRISEEALGPDHPLVAKNLGNLAGLHRRMGGYEEAERKQRRALEILENKQGPGHPDVVPALNNLGDLLTHVGRTDEARPFLDRALTIREKQLGPDHPDVARVLINLALLNIRTDRLDAAAPLLERALSIRQASLDDEHPDVAATLRHLADLAHRRRDYVQAKALSLRALEINEKNFGADHPSVAAIQRALAAIQLDTGNLAGAVETALRADVIGRNHLRLTSRTLSERQALAYAEVRPAGQHLALSAVVAKPDADGVRSTWNAVIRSRAMVLDEMRVRHDAASREARSFAELARTSEQLGNLLVRGPRGMSIEQYRRVLQSARAELDRAQQELARDSLSFRRQTAATEQGLAEVVAALPPGAALVAYLRYERRIPPDGDGAPRTVSSYLAMVRRAGDSRPHVQSLGTAEEIDALVLEWRREIAAARRRLPAFGRSGASSYDRAGTGLRERVWEPVARHLSDTDLVFIVPDGALQLVSLATLPDGAGGYLVQTAPPLHYLSAERDLIREAALPERGRGLLVMGSPDYDRVAGNDPAKGEPAPPGVDSPDGCTDLRSLRFEPLPGTSRETELVASLWDGPANEIRRRIGAAATEATFKREATGRRAIHLATHGFFVDDPCTGDPGSSEGTIRSLMPSSPDRGAVLSGLALAGANLRGLSTSGIDGDGMLTAEEIASVDLNGVDWVVLSACETGLGSLRTGEGVLGLRRSFEIAGARTLIMSLWAVEDVATEAWMRRLYGFRKEGRSAADSVRRASLELLRLRAENGQSTHPFYWGAFMAVGDWR